MIRTSVFDTAPQQKGPSGDVFRLRNGAVRRGKPVSLAVWRFTMESPDVAETLAEMFGGDVSDNDSDREPLQVLSTSDSIEVLIAQAGIDTGFALWQDGRLVRKCDGVTQTHGDEVGMPCPCAGLSWDERRAAGAGTCRADIRVKLTLADAPDLAEGVYYSGNLSLMRDIQRLEAKVQDADGPTKATMLLSEVRMSSGKVFTKVSIRDHK